MYIQFIQRVEVDPETEDELLKKYSSDKGWNIIYNGPDKVVFESMLPKYKSEPMYMSGII